MSDSVSRILRPHVSLTNLWILNCTGGWGLNLRITKLVAIKVQRMVSAKLIFPATALSAFRGDLHGASLQAYKYEDRLLINPGSATGAYGSMNANAGPSFVLMDINGAKVRHAAGPTAHSGGMTHLCWVLIGLHNTAHWFAVWLVPNCQTGK